MKVLELFAGSCSFSNVSATYGFETFTVDNGLDLKTLDHYAKVDLIKDILKLDTDEIPLFQILSGLVHLVPHLVLLVVDTIGMLQMKVATEYLKQKLLK